MSRSRAGQSRHDAAVEREARRLANAGYNVHADLKDFDQPKTIGGYRPDIIATKGATRVIVEVETPDSREGARAEGQDKAFSGAADRSAKTTFKTIVTRK